jgi:NADH-quinone oxidoreductase subunit A
MTPVSIAGYMALFVLLTCGFLFVHLAIGRLLRPNLPNQEKLQIYECGEPTIGSSFVQFDLRFYVVALLFIIFDVEVAFFFPWATVFGKSTHLMDPRLVTVEAAADSSSGQQFQLTPDARQMYTELGIPAPAMPQPVNDRGLRGNQEDLAAQAKQLALVSMGDILVFFAVVLVGYAYVWSRGDLDWVRAVSQERARQSQNLPTRPERPAPQQEPALV